MANDDPKNAGSDIEPGIDAAGATQEQSARGPAEPVIDELAAAAAVAQSEAAAAGSAAAGIETKLEFLIPNVLSMSESILQLAETSGQLTSQLRSKAADFEEIIEDYDQLLQRKNRHTTVLLGVSVGVIVLSLLLVLIMSVSFSRQVNNMNALALTLGKRISEVNSGLVTFEELNLSIGRLETAVLSVAESMQQQGATVDAMAAAQTAADAAMLENLNAALQGQTTAVSGAVGGLEAAVASSAGVVDQSSRVLQSLRLEVDNVGNSMDELLALRQSLEALITLERERYLEQLQAQQAAASATAAPEADTIRFQRPVPPPVPSAPSTP